MRHLPLRLSVVWVAIGCLALTARVTRAADPLHDAKKRVADAQTDLTKAKVAVSLAAKKLLKQLEATPEWQKAMEAQREASLNYTAAAKLARESLVKQASYKAAVAEQSKREAERDALRAQPASRPSNPDEKAPDKQASRVTLAAIAAMKAKAKVHDLEQQAFAANPEVTAAKSDLDDANATLAELRRDFMEHVKDDPTFVEAREHLQQASTAFDQAAKDLDQARRQQASEDEQKLGRDLDTHRQQMRERSGF